MKSDNRIELDELYFEQKHSTNHYPNIQSNPVERQRPADEKWMTGYKQLDY